MSASLIFDFSATTDPAAIAPPGELVLLVIGDVLDTVVLSWGGSTRAHHTTYIERSTNGTTWTALANVPARIHTYTDTTATDVTVGTTYYYRVRAWRDQIFDGKTAREPVYSAYTP